METMRMDNGSSQAAKGAGPKLDCEKEIRFAVVMYGGVSLAIYINGVAQELLSVVRATAPMEADGKTGLPGKVDFSPPGSLRANERVYRKVSHLISTRYERSMELKSRLEPAADSGNPEERERQLKELEDKWLDDAERAT